MKKIYRQGDVLFVRVARVPKGERRARRDGMILEGEATGHVHRVDHAQLEIAEVYEIEERLFLSAREDGVAIVHEEHGPIVLPAGDYEIIRQREYSPDKIRNVAD